MGVHYRDLCELEAYPHKYASVRRYVRRLTHQHPKLVDVMEHPPGEEAQVDFFQGPPTFHEAQGRWRRPQQASVALYKAMEDYIYGYGVEPD